MIISRCPITGIKLELESKFAGQTLMVTSLHPIFSADCERLAKLSPKSADDSRLLFLALAFKLHELHYIDFRGAPDELSAHWLSQELPHLQTFVQWANVNSTNIRKDLLPIFRLDFESSAQNFQSWRQECQEIIATWDTMLDASIARHIKREREAALALLNAPVNVQSKIQRSPRVSRVQARLSFVRDALESFSDMGVSLIDFYLKVLALPHTYEVVQLQRTKDCFLDYLPDSSIEDYNDKKTCLQILDAAIMEKVGLSRMLGIGATSQEEADIVENIRSENSHYSDGRRFVTSVNATMNTAMHMLDSRRVSSIPELPVYTVEPVRADFASELGFKIAYKAWVKYCATLATVQECEIQDNGSAE